MSPRPIEETSVPLTVVIDRSEAALIVGLLESAGVGAFALGDEAAGQEPQWQLLGGVKIMVPPDQLQAAREILDDVRRRDELAPTDREGPDDDTER